MPRFLFALCAAVMMTVGCSAHKVPEQVKPLSSDNQKPQSPDQEVPGQQEKESIKLKGKIVVAHVTSWSRVVPVADRMTHINYAFGHVNSTFEGIRIDNESRIKSIVKLKEQNPGLYVMLSLGGWGSGNFSEMVSAHARRSAFVKDCRRVIEEFGLDGIDMDWEFPTSSAAGISSSPEDTDNFTLLMKEIRKEIGNGKFLTLASASNADYVDFKAILDCVDFINIMAYDMGAAPDHQAALYRTRDGKTSAIAGWVTSEEAVKAHLNAGIPAEKLVLGMPFYGRGSSEYGEYMDYKDISGPKSGHTEKWDEVECTGTIMATMQRLT